MRTDNVVVLVLEDALYAFPVVFVCEECLKHAGQDVMPLRSHSIPESSLNDRM